MPNKILNSFASVISQKPIVVLAIGLILLLISAFNIPNFKLEASTDSLVLDNDENLKDSEALKKTLEHFDIIHKDLISIFNKNDIKQIDSINKKLDIIGCWINDMKDGEYNPPHTHHNLTACSTVMFLKVPEFVNDAKDSHKFKDGQLGFISHKGVSTLYVTPKVGDFYIFEAKHQHCVMPFKTKIPGEIRRSMSFNFIQKK